MKTDKNFIACILSLSMLFTSFVPAYAQKDAMAVTDAMGNPVSGSVQSTADVYVKGSAQPGEIAMVSVLRPMEEGTVLSDGNLGMHLYWADDMLVPSNGSYSFPLDFSLCSTGDYAIRVSFSSYNRKVYPINMLMATIQRAIFLTVVIFFCSISILILIAKV